MDISGIDSALHAPARLQIAAVLARVSDAEFATLKEITGVADSVLSKHLAALSDAGYVKLRKAARDGRQRTWASLTGTGRTAFAAHIAVLRQLAAIAEETTPTK